MAKNHTRVFSDKEVRQRIQRIAWEIYEIHAKEKQLILAGISRRGYVLAELIADKLKEISKLEVTLGELNMDKDHPTESGVSFSLSKEEYRNGSVIVVDDVLNSGKTLIYGVNFFLDVPLKRLTTAVLVDRSHKRYPVKADVKGVSLSTSLKETVEVQIEKEPYGVSLV